MADEKGAMSGDPGVDRVVIARNELADVLGAWTTFAERMARELIERSPDPATAGDFLRRMARAHDLAVCRVTRQPLLREHAQQVAQAFEAAWNQGAGATPNRPGRRRETYQPRKR